jgi:hypothetical protein
MTDRYFGIAASKLASVRPKRSVLEGIVLLPQRRRGRPARVLGGMGVQHSSQGAR